MSLISRWRLIVPEPAMSRWMRASSGWDRKSDEKPVL